MSETVIVADGDGNYYRFDSARLDASRRDGPEGEYHDITPAELAAARISDTARAALQTALTYEQAGGLADPASGAEVRLGRPPANVVLRIVGRIE